MNFLPLKDNGYSTSISYPQILMNFFEGWEVSQARTFNSDADLDWFWGIGLIFWGFLMEF